MSWFSALEQQCVCVQIATKSFQMQHFLMCQKFTVIRRNGCSQQLGFFFLSSNSISRTSHSTYRSILPNRENIGALTDTSTTWNFHWHKRRKQAHVSESQANVFSMFHLSTSLAFFGLCTVAGTIRCEQTHLSHLQSLHLTRCFESSMIPNHPCQSYMSLSFTFSGSFAVKRLWSINRKGDRYITRGRVSVGASISLVRWCWSRHMTRWHGDQGARLAWDMYLLFAPCHSSQDANFWLFAILGVLEKQTFGFATNWQHPNQICASSSA